MQTQNAPESAHNCLLNYNIVIKLFCTYIGAKRDIVVVGKER